MNSLSQEWRKKSKEFQGDAVIPVWVMRVCVSKVIPGWVHKCIHGVCLPLRWALTSDRRQGERELAEAAQRAILGWQIRNKWTISVCFMKLHIRWFMSLCECKAGSIWLWGSRPRRAAQLKPDWHHSSVSVPWLTGCANRERSGRLNTWSCVCVGNATPCPFLYKPNSTRVCDVNLPTSLSDGRRGQSQRHGKRVSGKCFLFQV